MRPTEIWGRERRDVKVKAEDRVMMREMWLCIRREFVCDVLGLGSGPQHQATIKEIG